ncbi:MAG TPA: phosphate ABC transporter substrate-binding protein PstS [Anaerolineales bacterium]|nr:phosphate ABC transporter substrate-binding protein PstS [Anaerolineales bacterium]
MFRKYNTLLVVLVAAALVLSSCSTSANASSSTPTSSSSSASSGNPQTSPVTINGAGSTFAQPVYTQWIQSYKSVNSSVALNYQGIGSGGGKKGIIDNTLDFAGSDSVLSSDEYAAGKDLQMYPTLAGAVVLIYNLPGLTQTLTLDGVTLAAIYSGKITRWNDPAITALNPGMSLPDASITAVHRSDGSGTTEIFTNALSAFSTDWQNSVGAGTSVEWPVDKAGNGIGGKGSQGVTAAVQNTPNSIGYVELSFAIANKIAFATMINKAGNKVTANADTLQAAMNDFASSFTPQLTNTIVNGPGANSWPIAGFTYLILHTSSMADCAKAQQLLQFFKWALTDPAPAKQAADLGYSVLPQSVQTQVLASFGQVTCNGAPVLSTP